MLGNNGKLSIRYLQRKKTDTRNLPGEGSSGVGAASALPSDAEASGGVGLLIIAGVPSMAYVNHLKLNSARCLTISALRRAVLLRNRLIDLSGA